MFSRNLAFERKFLNRRSLPNRPGPEEVLRKFYAAIAKRDFDEVRSFIDENIFYWGPSTKCYGKEGYIRILYGLLMDAEGIEVKEISEQQNEIVVIYDLVTGNAAESRIPVAEYHKVKNGRIVNVESTYDGKPYKKSVVKGNAIQGQENADLSYCH